MITFMAMRIAYGIYFIAIFLLVTRLLASIIFNRFGFKKIISEIWFIVVWPLSLLTPKGRKRLWKSMPFITN